MKVENNKTSRAVLFGCAFYAMTLLLFLQFAVEGYDITSRIVAWLVFVIGSLPFAVFIHKKNVHLPFIELIMFAYVNAFALPIFFESENTLAVKRLYPDTEPVLYCLVLVLLAISALWAGFKMAPLLLKTIRFPKIKLLCDDGKLFYYGVFLCMLSLLLGRISFGNLNGLANILASSTLGIAIIAFLYFKKTLGRSKRLFSLLVLVLLVLNGISTTMTQAILQPLMIWFVCRWLVTRKLELGLVLSGAVLFVLLQPVKLQYRDIVLRENSESISVVDKIDQFSELFYEYWFLESADNKMVESVSTRTSLLLQTAHVIDWTPAVVPYRNGETFQYMFVTLVPRVIWPKKPVAQQASIDYATDYGVTSVEGTKRSMFGVGHLGEVFMNFGPLGVLPMYILIGILSFLPIYMIRMPKIAPLTQNILRNDLPVAPLALLIAVLFKFIFIGTSVSDTYGGIIQLIIVQGFMLYLFAKQKQSRSLQ